MNRHSVCLAGCMMIAGFCPGAPGADVCCPDQLPADTLAQLETTPLAGEKGPFTTVLVDIDPLGAVGPVPWIVHSTPHLNVRTGPSVSTTDVGDLLTDTTVEGDYYLVVQSDEEWLNFDFGGQSRWSSVTGLTRPHPTNMQNIGLFGDLPIGDEIVNRWWGIPISYVPSDLVSIPPAYAGGHTSRQLRAEAVTQAMAMIDSMRLDGLDMFISSAYRSGPTQKSIYDGNVQNSGRNQRFSAPPGHSEHQLGVTSDFARPGGGFLNNSDPQHAWLDIHGASFGFRQTYTAENTDETGYIEEPWHWRYVGVQAGESAWRIY